MADPHECLRLVVPAIEKVVLAQRLAARQEFPPDIEELTRAIEERWSSHTA
jgi:hypothetical protein